MQEEINTRSDYTVSQVQNVVHMNTGLLKEKAQKHDIKTGFMASVNKVQPKFAKTALSVLFVPVLSGQATYLIMLKIHYSEVSEDSDINYKSMFFFQKP